jgi:ribosomal protein S18 acetylase RimI-like enzyme
MIINTQKKIVTLSQMSNFNFDKKFNIFYKFRFHSDYLEINTNKKKYSRIESKIWFKKNIKFKKLFAIKIVNKIIGLIIYNLDNYFYSIIILKKYRNQGTGSIALIKLIKFLKKNKFKLVTLVKKNNKSSVHLHKKISKSYKSINKLFYYFIII